jgi:4-amino-4-deoxy-L-arabinose transferase-like glycosyltransferase
MTGILRGQRPDLTPAQLVGVALAGVPVIATLLHAFGVYDVSAEQQQALQDTVTWGGVLGGLLFASDAGLRAARNHADARRDAAALSAPTGPQMLPEVDEEDEEDAQLADAPLDAVALEGLVGPQSSSIPDMPEDL